MNIDEIKAAIGGPVPVPHQPEGPSSVVPLTGHHQARVAAESAPANVAPDQGAGAPGNSLTPAPGEPADGSVNVGWKGHQYEGAASEPHQAGTTSSSSSGKLPLSSLTPSGSGGRPEGGLDGQAAVPGGLEPAPANAAGGGTGGGLNPLLGRMSKTAPGRVR